MLRIMSDITKLELRLGLKKLENAREVSCVTQHQMSAQMNESEESK